MYTFIINIEVNNCQQNFINTAKLVMTKPSNSGAKNERNGLKIERTNSNYRAFSWGFNSI
jgi:hypothetical protein